MQIRNFTKGGNQLLEIVRLKTSSEDYRYVAVLKGFPMPIIYNEQGVCEEANEANGNDDLNLVMIPK